MKALKVYQFENYFLVQITDGRSPYTLPENAAGWKHRQTISDNMLSAVTTVAPSQVMNEIQRYGYISIENFEIQEAWKARWAKQRDDTSGQTVQVPASGQA